MNASLSNNYIKFYQKAVFLIRLYLLALGIFLISRIVFIISYGNFSELANYKLDLLHSFATGLRFDTVVFTYLFLIILFFVIINWLFVYKNGTLQKIFDVLFIVTSTILFTIIILLIIVDFYFYKFFSSHFNITFFGFFDDDTKAIIKSIWTDYPVVLIIFLLLLAVLIFQYIIRKLYYSTKSLSINNKVAKWIFFLVFIPGYLFGMRSSVGHVPLEFTEASISANSFINDIPMNSLFALKNALLERSKGRINFSMDDYLKYYNYNSVDDLLSDYKHLFTNDQNGSDTDGHIKATSSKNLLLEENPPNVVFLLLEGLSSHQWKLHSKTFNLFGSLESELKKCLVFKNYVSCRNLTIYTMDGLLVNSSLSPLSQSKYLNVSFPSSALKPFVQNGYETKFVSGGRMNWRNLDQFLPRQGFQSLEDGSNIKENCPEAIVEHEWGVFDEFLMKRIVQILKSPNNKPQFIFGLTITNHTPYKVPDSYKSYPLVLSEDLKTQMKLLGDYVLQTFLSYQYMCDCLGWFINQVTESGLAENTIIVATGDHTSHADVNSFGFTDKDFMDAYGVPLILYIPPKYRNNLNVDTLRFGSHKDIFPTLYNLSLSNTRYYNNGDNLFSPDTLKNYWGIYEYNSAINKYGCVKYTNNKFNYFNWQGKAGGKLIESNENPSAEIIHLGEMLRAYAAFDKYQVINQISDKDNTLRKVK
jgi:phosphoglycerol transferase MdoB-like AlkP superfamily enzyme